jgi:hypothetical protein
MVKCIFGGELNMVRCDIVINNNKIVLYIKL